MRFFEDFFLLVVTISDARVGALRGGNQRIYLSMYLSLYIWAVGGLAEVGLAKVRAGGGRMRLGAAAGAGKRRVGGTGGIDGTS